MAREGAAAARRGREEKGGTRAAAMAAVALVMALAMALAPAGCDAKGTDAIQRLRSKSAEASGGVWRVMNTEEFRDVTQGDERPYSIVAAVMLPDHQLQREAESIKQTAKTVSKTFSDSVKKYKKAVADSEQDVFFVFIEFNPDTADIFDKLEIQSFPSLVLIPKNFRIDFAESSFHVGAELRPNVANKEAFYEFLDTFLGLEIFTAEKEEPSVSFFNIILAYFTIVLIGRMLWTISKNDMLVPLMAVGSIGVYWLSTSGIIKCIIHGLPMVTYDHDRKPRVFVHDSKNQTILEGFTMSTCYVLIAICLSTFTFVLPYVKNQNIKQLGLYTTFVFGILAYFFTMEAFQWKTHMRALIYGFNL